MFQRTQRSIIATAVLAALPALCAFAQTSDTWGVDYGSAGGSWGLASNWVHGVVPDNGGTVLFNTLPTATTFPVTIIQNLPTVSISKFTFDSQITYLIKPVSGNTITLTGAATLDAPIPSINTQSITTFGHQFQIGITGSSGLVKTGPGTVSLLTNTNNFTGGTQVNGGVLVTRSIGDAAFGATSGSVSFNGGTIRVTTLAWTSARTIQLNANGGTIETNTAAATMNGPIIGNGNFIKTGSRGLGLTANNTYSGSTDFQSGSITISGNGALPNTTSIAVRDSLILDNINTNVTDRINNAAPVLFQGTTFSFLGNASAPASESFGTTTFSRGTTTVSVIPGAGQSALVSLGTFSREYGAMGFFRGTALGSALGAGVSNVTLASAPTLVGGGGTTPTNVSIIPWAYGNTDAAAAVGAATNSFVTYGANGVRPLNLATEYVTTIAAAGATDNVRITASEAVNSAVTVNSLITTGASTAISGAGTLNVTSGAFMNVGTTTIANPVDFGSAEGVLLSTSTITLNGAIAGSGGLTKHGAGVAVFNAANTYSGTTTIGGGTASFTSSVASGSPSAFGISTSDIILAPAGIGTGGTTGRIAYAGTSAATFDRNLKVSGRIATANAATPPGFGVATAQSLTMNGSISLDSSPLILLGVASSTLTLNGAISGTGLLTDQASTSTSTIQINGDNSFTQGVEMASAIWQLGSDTALGSGMIKTVQLSGFPTIQAVGGPRIVPNDTVSFSSASTYWQISGNQDITFTGSINLSGGYTHAINNSALTTYAGVLHTGGFTKSGTGTLVLSNSNIYSGTTNLSAGVLRVTNSGALGTTASQTIVASGAMLELQNNALTSEPVTINGAGTLGLGAINSQSGVNSVGNVSLAATSTIGVQAGRLTTGNVDGAAAQDLTKTGAGSLVVNRTRTAGLTVDAGKLAVATGSNDNKTSIATSLTINTGASASFDLGDNSLIVNYTGGSALAGVTGYLQSGYNAGAWNGSGIVSSLALSNPGTAIAAFEATDLFTSFPATFAGQSVDNTSVLTLYTLAGDATLDRKIDTLDFNQLAGGFGTPSGAKWVSGDFDYDGDVDSIDFGLLAGTYGRTLPVSASLGAVVPEPTALSSLMAVALLARRSTRRRA